MEAKKIPPTHETDHIVSHEALYQATFENAAVGIAHVKLDGTFLNVNTKFCEIAGYSKEEMIALTFQEITHPEDLEKDVNLANQVANGEIQNYAMEKRYIRKDGSYVWINLTVSADRDMDDNARHFIAIIEDISSRREMEAEVRKSSRFLDLIFRYTLGSLVLTDKDFNFIRVNEVYADACGKKVSDFPGRNHFEMFPSDFEQVWRDVRDAKEPWQVSGRPFVFPDHPEWGVTYWNISLVPMLDDDGEVEAFLFSLNDVTEMKRAEEELRRSEIRLNEAQSIANIGSWELDIESGKFGMSPETCNILGVLPDEAGETLDFFKKHLVETDRVRLQTAIDEAIGGKNFAIEHDVVRKDGTVRAVSQKGQVNFDRSGIPTRMIGTIQDVTERRQVEMLKEDFISTISHELRTPLTSIMGSLGLIIGNQVGEIPDTVQQMLQVAYQNGERLTLLINGLLDIQKIESGNLELHLDIVPLNDLLNEAVSANTGYAEKLNVKLSLTPCPQEVLLMADRNRMMQVLSNLISNGIKFSPKGEVVTVSAEVINSIVRVSVNDNGAGIQDEFKPKIFKKFSQAETGNLRNVEGTGLGLSISKAIIEDHGGMIDFISEDSKGSTFFFELPLHQKNG